MYPVEWAQSMRSLSRLQRLSAGGANALGLNVGTPLITHGCQLLILLFDMCYVLCVDDCLLLICVC